MRASTRAKALVGTPVRAFTRERRLAAKSTSPRIAASVAAVDLGAAAGLVGEQLDHLVADERRVGIEDEQEAGGWRGHPSTLAPRSTLPCAVESGVDVHALADHGDAACR